MINKKYFFITIVVIKYTLLISYIPELESTRYISFFSQCKNIVSCYNPYASIESLQQSFMTFPYSNLMYFVLLPFYFIASFFGISFVNLSYFFFEIVLIILLKKIFNTSLKHLYFLVVLNPLIIYSMAYLGQLDLVPLSFFLISLYFLKEKKKFESIFFIILALSSKIIFIIVLPGIILYFLKHDNENNEAVKTLAFTLFFGILLNIQFLIDDLYFQTVFYGVSKGYEIINSANNFFDNAFSVLITILIIIFILFWNNIHRLDFIGICIFMGLLTFPLFILNTTNLGWALWSLPSLFIIFYSFDIKIKVLTYSFFSLLVLNDYTIKTKALDISYENIFKYTIYIFSSLIIFYFFRTLTENIYFKIKSRPILITIAGDSAVGKSTMTKLLTEYLGTKFVDKLELDSFHLYERNDEMWKKITHLNPESNNLDEYKLTVESLLRGNTSLVKNYNHLTGKFDSDSRKKIKNFLIIEGLHALYYDSLNHKFDLKVFLDLEENIKNTAKLKRDKERGKTEISILEEIAYRKKDYLKFIKPQEVSADVYINTLKRSDISISLNIRFPYQHYSELKSILNDLPGVKILETSVKHELVNFDLQINKKDINRFFDRVTKSIDNLKRENFDLENFHNNNSWELSCKLAIVLFLLDKRLQIRL